MLLCDYNDDLFNKLCKEIDLEKKKLSILLDRSWQLNQEIEMEKIILGELYSQLNEFTNTDINKLIRKSRELIYFF